MHTGKIFPTALILSLCLIAGFGLFFIEKHTDSEPRQITAPLATVAKQKNANLGAAQSPEKNWKQHLQEILSGPPWMQSQEELEELAGTLTEKQAREVLDDLARRDQGAAGSILGKILLQQWAQKSPAEAAKWVSQLPEGAFAIQAYRAIVIPWATLDLSAAVAWAQQLPPGKNKEAALLSLGSEAASQGDALTAITLISNIPASPERDALINYAARKWAITEQSQALAWIHQLPDPALRESILGELALDLGINDPPRAAAFTLTNLSDAKIREQALVNIVRFWSAASPEAAASWVTQFSDSSLRDTAMRNVIDVWGKDDPAEVGMWLNQHPADASHDTAISAYASAMAASFPTLATQWAKTIQDQTLRTKTEARLGGSGTP